jgi:hypothetical protein
MARRVDVLDRTLALLHELVDADRAVIDATLKAYRCRLVLDEAASDGDAQAATATLVSLLVRSGLTVELDVPDIEVETALLDPGPLRQGLQELGDAILPGSISHDAISEADLAIVIGTSRPPARRVIHLGAVGDEARFGHMLEGWQPGDALVALAAAALVAGEALRVAVRDLPPAAPWAAAILGPLEQASVHLPGIPVGMVDLGELDIVSAGAPERYTAGTSPERGGPDSPCRAARVIRPGPLE